MVNYRLEKMILDVVDRQLAEKDPECTAVDLFIAEGFFYIEFYRNARA